jgi:glycosyltransferase involved in cell wall biosynthesis
VASEVDAYIANGVITRERIGRCFGRSSSVIHPPVETSRFQVGTPGERYVVLSELMPHKRIDVIVESFTRLGLPLTVIGDGPDLQRLRSLAGSDVEFVGRVSDAEVAQRLQSAAALVQCATEEFGIASVEAQAAGRPVLALAQGGALETVEVGKSGALFDTPDVATLTAQLGQFDPGAFDPADCIASSERFSVESFSRKILAAVGTLDSTPNAPRERQQDHRRGLWRPPLA